MPGAGNDECEDRRSGRRALAPGGQAPAALGVARLSQPLPGLWRRPTVFGYLKVAQTCDQCGEELHHQRADDAPAYFTITIVAHVIIPLVVVAELSWRWPYWLHALIWFPATLALTFWLMPRVKGAIIGLQWALAMHGFGTGADDETHSTHRLPEP